MVRICAATFASVTNALLKADEKHLIEKTGERLRGMMPWMPKRNIKGAQAAY